MFLDGNETTGRNRVMLQRRRAGVKAGGVGWVCIRRVMSGGERLYEWMRMCMCAGGGGFGFIQLCIFFNI